jgi:capsular polysaccharide biosynthesis protein
MMGGVEMGTPGPPSGVYNTTWDWASAFVQNGGDVWQYYRMISDLDHTIVQHGPYGMDESLYMTIFQYHLQNLVPYKFVAMIPEGRVCGPGAVISPDNRLIWDVSMDFFGMPHTHTILSKQTMPELTYIPGTAAVLTAPGCQNYYHWLVDVLPRMELLRRTGIHIDKYIINCSGTIGFQNETLSVLGISRDQVIDCPEGTHFQAQTLVVPGMVSARSLMPKWPIHFLRQELLHNRGIQQVNGYERIYISRAYATHRKIVNESAVTKILEACGFRTVYLEHLSVAEAAQIFSSSKAIVAAHGAGLTNLVFCTPGTKVMELFAPRYVNLCFWVMSNHAGLDYRYLLGEGPWPATIDPVTGAGIGGQDPIYVNEVQLWIFIEKMMAT